MSSFYIPIRNYGELAIVDNESEESSTLFEPQTAEVGSNQPHSSPATVETKMSNACVDSEKAIE